MSLSPPVFLLGCGFIISAGIIWTAANPRANEATTAGPPPSLRPPTASSDPLQDTSLERANLHQATVLAPVSNESAELLTLIRPLLDQQRQFGPADRESEDENRCRLLALLTDENAASIVKALHTEERRSEFGVAALARWAATDVISASLWLAQQEAPTSDQTWVMAQRLVNDAVVMEVLLERLPASPWRERLLENASLASLPHQPGNAVRIAQSMQPHPARTRVLLGIVDEWALLDPAAAARWIAAEPSVPLRDELVGAAATARASTDPMAALDWTLLITSDATFERIASKIAFIAAERSSGAEQIFKPSLVSHN